MTHKLSYVLDRAVNKVCQYIYAAPQDSDVSFIAMFHNVLRDNEAVALEYECYESELICFINMMSAQGVKFVSLDELLTLPKEEAEKKKCVITFDDGYASVFTLAAPILHERKIPFTVYVTTSFLNTKDYLSSDQLKKLSQMPYCTIGMHSHDHVMFRFKTNKELIADYNKCRAIISEITGNFPIHYAFPYGSVYACSYRNCRVVRGLGAKSVAMTMQIRLRRSVLGHHFYLPRLDIPSWYRKY